MTDNSKENGISKTCFSVIVVLSLIIGSIIGAGAVFYLVPYVSEEIKSFIQFIPDNIIIIALILGVFLFALARFFDTKTEGFGRFTTSALIIMLALMVAVVVFLIDPTRGEDVAKIIFTVTGFAGGLLVGKSEKKPKKKNDTPSQ